MLPPAEDIMEHNIDFLASMMGGDLDREVTRKVLWKHNGNVEKAADAILQGDRGEDMWLSAVSSHNTGSTISPSQMPPAPTTRVIDLTAEDEDMNRAFQLSMESIDSSPNEIRFGPSDRAPDPAWQMVPSNLNVQVETTVSQEDQHIKEAIQASLKESVPSDESDVFPFEDTVREGGRPVAMRSEAPELAYAALVFQALFHVPQIREQMATMQLPDVDADTPMQSSSRAILNLVEYFVNLDLAQLSAIVDKELLVLLQARSLNMALQSVGEFSADFLKSLAHLITNHLNAHREENESESRLFFFRHGTVEYYPNMPRRIKKTASDGFVVLVDVNAENIPNDLVGALSANLSRYTETISAHDVIMEPSDVVAFHLQRQRSTHSNVDPFVYPKSMFLDRFLLNNVELSNQKRRLEQEMNVEISKLLTQKEMLTRHNNRDTLTDLRTTLYYYENVAIATDEEREHQIQQTAAKLKSILAAITDQLNAIDEQIENLRVEVASVFDCHELQCYRYDLRAVLVHTGLPGRKQIYSYVQDVDGNWWKTVDFTVTEASEEMVLTDPSGLHMNAGPYLLLYSRYVTQDRIKAPLPWPKPYVDGVEASNATLFSLIPSELAAKAKIPPSLSSPVITN